MKSKIMTWAFVSLLAFLTACGGSDTTVTEAEEAAAEEELAEDLNVEEIQEDTASEVVTTLADVQGFVLTTNSHNPHAYDIYGTEVTITAWVKDHSNNDVDDGTVVTFIADDNGLVEDQCATISGKCSVTWTSSRDNNYNDDFEVTVMGRTLGEDSFIDKNANSLWDTNEVRITQSEPFLDANENGSYDSGLTDYDEYFDFNNDGSFTESPAFTKFRGESCSAQALSADAAHCTERIEVWNSVTFTNSAAGRDPVTGYAVNVAYCDGSALSPIVLTSTLSKYCLEFTDRNGNVPPLGTEIEISTDNGVIVVQHDGKVANLDAELGTGDTSTLAMKADDETSTNGTITIKTTSVSGAVDYAYIDVSDTAAAPVAP